MFAPRAGSPNSFLKKLPTSIVKKNRQWKNKYKKNTHKDTIYDVLKKELYTNTASWKTNHHSSSSTQRKGKQIDAARPPAHHLRTVYCIIRGCVHPSLTLNSWPCWRVDERTPSSSLQAHSTTRPSVCSVRYITLITTRHMPHVSKGCLHACPLCCIEKERNERTHEHPPPSHIIY